jgi:hypothetical protein
VSTATHPADDPPAHAGDRRVAKARNVSLTQRLTAITIAKLSELGPAQK